MERSHTGEKGCRDPSALTWHAQHEKQLPGTSGKHSDLAAEDPTTERLDCRKEIRSVTAGEGLLAHLCPPGLISDPSQSHPQDKSRGCGQSVHLIAHTQRAQCSRMLPHVPHQQPVGDSGVSEVQMEQFIPNPLGSGQQAAVKQPRL